MSREVAFDTNLLIRWILQDVSDQAARVLEILKDPEVKEIHVADMALAEVVWILGSSRVGYDRKDIVELLDIVFRYPKIRYNQALMDVVLPFYASHPAVSFADACLTGYAELGSHQLLTFDKKLSRQSKYAKLIEI